MKKTRKVSLMTVLCAGSAVFQGCPAGGVIGGVLGECFGGDTISASGFDDLNPLEQLLYEENDCGRYEPRSGFLGDLL